MTHQELVDALQKIRPGAMWTLTGDAYENLVWHDAPETKPSVSELLAAIKGA